MPTPFEVFADNDAIQKVKAYLTTDRLEGPRTAEEMLNVATAHGGQEPVWLGDAKFSQQQDIVFREAIVTFPVLNDLIDRAIQGFFLIHSDQNLNTIVGRQLWDASRFLPNNANMTIQFRCWVSINLGGN